MVRLCMTQVTPLRILSPRQVTGTDKRAEKKGVEPESVTVGTYGGTRMLFVGAERANAVGVYDILN